MAADEVEVHPSTEMEAMLWVPVLERLMPGMNVSHRGKKGSAGERQMKIKIKNKISQLKTTWYRTVAPIQMWKTLETKS